MPVANSGLLDGLRKIGGRFRDLTIDGGLPGAPLGFRMRGATLSGAPTTGTWKAGDVVTDRTGCLWQCTAAGTGAAAQWARLKPAGPSSIYPEDFGAKPDGKMVTDGAMTAASNVLTCATSAPFTPGDVGKYVLVWGAGATVSSQPTYLFAQITGFTSASTVTLSVNASNSTSAWNAGGCGVVYGTDNTAAIQAAVNAANTRSLLGNGVSATVQFSDGIYCLATTAILGSGAGGNNAQITLPIVPATTGLKSQISLAGTGRNQLPHWTQANPSQSGTILLSMPTTGALNNTYGPTTVIAGPVSSYGGGGGAFSNMHVKIHGLSIMVPMSKGAYSGIDLYGVGQATIDDYSYLPLAVIPTSVTNANAAPWPCLATFGSATFYPTYSFGLRMPSNGNNAVADIGTYTCYFTFISLIGSEHCTVTSMQSLYSEYGFLPMTGTGGTVSHGVTFLHWCCASTNYPIGSTGTGFFALNCAISIRITRLDLESYTSVIYDSAAKLFGEVNFNVISTASSLLSSLYVSATAITLTLKRIEVATGLVASPPAMPATATAQLNGYYRDATVNVQPGTATITSITVDATVLTGITSGPVFVPAGHTITLAYTGGTPVWQWTLA